MKINRMENNMKQRRFVLAILSFLAVIFLSLGLVACGANDINDDETWSMERIYNLARDNGYQGSYEDFNALFKGESGDKGDKGDKGENGENGIDGVGIKSAYIDESGHLILVLTNDEEIDAGPIKSETDEKPFAEGLSYQATKTYDNKKQYLVSGIGLVAEYDVVIPDTFNGCPVVGILENAFKGNTVIQSVTIPDSVGYIGSFAFSECSNLTSVTIGSGIGMIETYAFNKCENLTEFHISDLAGWCNVILNSERSNPLYYAHNLYLGGELVNSLAIPESVTKIERYTFYNGDSITNISIPDSVTQIDEYAFEGTAYLKNEANYENGVLYIGKHLIKANATIPAEYTIENDTLTIAARAFQSCQNLKSVEIPEGVTCIPYSSFADCKNLESVTMGSKVTMIYISAFIGCKKLSIIHLPDSIDTIEAWAFFDCDSLTEIYYAGTMKQWQNISKGKEWDCGYKNTISQRSYTVHCKDKDISVVI